MRDDHYELANEVVPFWSSQNNAYIFLISTTPWTEKERDDRVHHITFSYIIEWHDTMDQLLEVCVATDRF